MKDFYPKYDTIPDGALVPPDAQPEYVNVPGVTLPPDANLGDLLSDAHVRQGRGPDSAILQHETGEVLTFADIAKVTNRLADALAWMGVRPGDRVAFRSPNRAEPILVSIAAWKIGAIVVPIPLQAREAEIRFLLADTTPRVCVVWTGDESALSFAEALQTDERASSSLERRPVVVRFGPLGPPVDRTRAIRHEWLNLRGLADGVPRIVKRENPSLDSVAVVWHTGGTTGIPKACYHTQRRYLLGGYALGMATGAGPGQRWAAAAPLGHALGFIYHTSYTLLHGAGIVLMEQFADAKVLTEAISKHQVGTFTAIASTWANMLGATEDSPHLDLTCLQQAYAMWQSASSSMVYDGWRRRGVELLNNFGSTAFATWVLAPWGDREVPRAALGWPIPGYSVQAMDTDGSAAGVGVTGRMVVRGPTGLTYWNRPELQRRDVVGGWTLVDDLIRN